MRKIIDPSLTEKPFIARKEKGERRHVLNAYSLHGCKPGSRDPLQRVLLASRVEPVMCLPLVAATVPALCLQVVFAALRGAASQCLDGSPLILAHWVVCACAGTANTETETNNKKKNKCEGHWLVAGGWRAKDRATRQALEDARDDGCMQGWGLRSQASWLNKPRPELGSHACRCH